MPQSRRRRGVFAQSAIAACLVALVSAVNIGFNTVWSAPPRFDGAGYAVLAQSWLRGEGYRAIDHPDRPRHAHFPPGYPLILALTWGLAGKSAAAGHAVSSLFTVGATLAAWLWFRSFLSGPTALALGLALAVNWIWARTGSAIQSEPLYLFLSHATLLAAVTSGRRTALGTWRSIALGALLAACVLTRQVALGLVAAVVIDLVARHRFADAGTALGSAALFVFPWVAWIATIGPAAKTQAGLLVGGDGTWTERLGRQSVFYLQRIPDQLTGPFVEVGTDLGRGPIIGIAANLWAAMVTGLIVAGWIRCMGRPRRRLAVLLALVTLAMLAIWPYTEAGRFLIPLIPCLLIGAVEGTVGLATLLCRLSGSTMRVARIRLYAASLILMASLPYSAYLLATGRARALESTHRAFDLACAWIAAHGDRPGPLISRHPGEVFWQTGRQGLEVSSVERPGDRDADPDTIARLIAAYKVAYLLIDQHRYAGAPRSPLAQFVAERPELAREVWRSNSGPDSVIIYEVSTGGPGGTPGTSL
jgi:Dolichyl-phosphate-mannose-protein mannosyltransferase